MTETSPSLLLSDDAKPDDGVTSASPVYWQGGPLNVSYTGDFEGVSLQLVMTVKMPPMGVIPEDVSEWIDDEEWLDLGDAVSAPGYIQYGEINPCLLALNITSSGADTRVKALVA